MFASDGVDWESIEKVDRCQTVS